MVNWAIKLLKGETLNYPPETYIFLFLVKVSCLGAKKPRALSAPLRTRKRCHSHFMQVLQKTTSKCFLQYWMSIWWGFVDSSLSIFHSFTKGALPNTWHPIPSMCFPEDKSHHSQQLLRGTWRTDSPALTSEGTYFFPPQSLSHCELITDEGILHLSSSTCGHERLRVLELDNCLLVTDAALEHLENCRGLERLELYDCQQVTRAGIKRMRVGASPSLALPQQLRNTQKSTSRMLRELSR